MAIASIRFGLNVFVIKPYLNLFSNQYNNRALHNITAVHFCLGIKDIRCIHASVQIDLVDIIELSSFSFSALLE